MSFSHQYDKANTIRGSDEPPQDQSNNHQEQHKVPAVSLMPTSTQQQQQSQLKPPPPQNQQNIAQKTQEQGIPHPRQRKIWHNSNHLQLRTAMTAKILKLLQERRPNADQEWSKILEKVAKHLERCCYGTAESLQEYNDKRTLKQRLMYFTEREKKRAQLKESQTARKKQRQQRQQQQQKKEEKQSWEQHRTSARQQQQQQDQPASRHLQPTAQPMKSTAMLPAPLFGQMPHKQTSNFVDANSVAGRNAKARPLPTHPSFPTVSTPATLRYALGTGPTQTGAANSAQLQDRALSMGRSSSRRPDLKQQLLLCLVHSSRCQRGDGSCPLSQQCIRMKNLWKHIRNCKNQMCLEPGCRSSRYVLAHYRRCTKDLCRLCGPLRECLRHSHERQKQSLERGLKTASLRSVEAIQSPPPFPSNQPSTQTQTEPPTKKLKTGEGGSVPRQPVLTERYSERTLCLDVAREAAPGASKVPYSKKMRVNVPKRKSRDDRTLIDSSSTEQIKAHIASLNMAVQPQPQKLKTECLRILTLLQEHHHGWIFNTPVDPVELGLPDYFEVIKRPMDLGTIKKNLKSGHYRSLEEFGQHVHLAFDNATLYNPEGSPVHVIAKDMKVKFVNDFANLVRQFNVEEDAKRKDVSACLLCGCKELRFKSPVYCCIGMNCGRRILRDRHYYTDPTNQFHWCQPCYGKMRNGQSLDLGETNLKKEQLTKKKNDQVCKESKVECDKCGRWVHQICGLFNAEQQKSQRKTYICPQCTIDDRKKRGVTEGTSFGAADLQRTKLSERLEKHVRKKVDEYFENAANKRPEEEGETRKGIITIRQVASTSRTLEVGERMKKRYAYKNYPDEFTFRCKCIIVFQNLDGVDCILFGLYVYEHDEKNPSPNKRAVYISYLDSVHYMRPRKMRTFIYHEIMISYLDYVRQKGFSTVHIWACPPLKGDDYILYAKPEDQKTPKDDRLRQWYLDMLVECQKRGIVGKVTNMYDLYFANENNDATVVPYMDGDYFFQEVENTIKSIQERNSNEKKQPPNFRSRPSCLPEGASHRLHQKCKHEAGGRDEVMVELGEKVKPMKENFIVAYLAPSVGNVEDLTVSRDAVEEELLPSASNGTPVSEDAHNSAQSTTNFRTSRSMEAKVRDHKSFEATELQIETSSNMTPATRILRAGKFAAMEVTRRRDIGGLSTTTQNKNKDSLVPETVQCDHGSKVAILDEDKVEIDSRFFNNRETFLSMCKDNHYQFDQLRRAKHSSMMILWQLFNQNASSRR